MTNIAIVVRNWWVYAVMIALGVPVGNAIPLEKMLQALIVIGTVILTALIATLLVPFAGFSLNEKWQKFAVQYGAVPTFGTYGALLYHWAGLHGMLLVVPPLLVHAGYWQSSIHSRDYRLKMFMLGFAPSMPHTTRLIAVLSAARLQHLADSDIISASLGGQRINLENIKRDLPGWGHLQSCATEEVAEEHRRAGLQETI